MNFSSHLNHFIPRWVGYETAGRALIDISEAEPAGRNKRRGFEDRLTRRCIAEYATGIPQIERDRLKLTPKEA
jgi:hypothetical protein